MTKSRIRSLLDKIFWHRDLDPKDFEVLILHRGAPNDVKVIPATSIIGIFKGGFRFRDLDGSEKMIPYHRVLLIRDRARNEVLFKRT